MDNSWIKEDRRIGNAPSKLTHTKIYLTVLIVVFGALGTVLLHGVGANATQYQSEGIVLDFGGYKTYWSDIDYNVTTDPVEMLDRVCSDNSCTYVLNSEGRLTSVTDPNGTDYDNSADASWGLWYVTVDSNDVAEYTRSETYSIDVSKFVVTIWAYTHGDDRPTIALDATNTSIYGYSQPGRLVTLSPVCTEIISSLSAVNNMVGTDYYSNYPSSVVAGKADGTIAMVGTFTEPSYESIMHTNPDIIICDGSQYSHMRMAEKVRSSDVNAVVIYDGISLETIYDNIFIVATAINYEMRAVEVIQEISDAVSLLQSKAVSDGYSAMIALNTDPAPIVAASETYINDIIYTIRGSNAFSALPGWAHANSEYVVSSNPEAIVILGPEMSPSEYEALVAGLPAEWKQTKGFQDGRVYVICGAAGDVAERAGPRIAQLTELMERILNPSAFPGEDPIPLVIGSDYRDYLTITKDMGYGD